MRLGSAAQKLDISQSVQDSLNIVERVRKSVMPWRGQFSPQLVEYLLSRHPAECIVDPFCGSGTVLYEAAAFDREAIGIDINPAAAILAEFSRFCCLSPAERLAMWAVGRDAIKSALNKYELSEIRLDFARQIKGADEAFVRCFLLLLFGEKEAAPVARTENVIQQLGIKLAALPHSNRAQRAILGDARNTGLPDESADLVITSPPYINVFNYHQHYRRITEALGFRPLSVAATEIGANRKHRQNRFLTVIQYGIDMNIVLRELWRILRPDTEAVLVVGRCSNVRGVSFYNSDIISEIAEVSEAFSVNRREERVFTNRFGARIFEDILTLRRRITKPHSEDVGRQVAASALRNAIERCTDSSAACDAKDAYERRMTIERSPTV